MSEYLPLYAERQCLICGFWRGQHTVNGDPRNDKDMQCPVDMTWWELERPATFVPGFARYEADKAQMEKK